MKTIFNQISIPLLSILLGLALPAARAADQYGYSQPGDKNYINNTDVLERTLGTTSSNNKSLKITAPRAQLNATFTTEAIAVDGVREAAWDAATAYPITNKFATNMAGLLPSATAEGTLRLLWDGPVLYGLVEVTGDSTKSDTGTPTWNVASYTPTTDGLFVFMDVFNEGWGMENDTTGVFYLGANPALAAVTSFNNSGIPSLGSFFNPANQDYSTRLKAFKSSGYVAGSGVNYTYEFALQIEGWGDHWDRALVNGTKIGLETAIFNQAASFTYLSKTLFYAGNEGGSNLPNSERVRNRDYAEVSLAGWDGTTPFAYSGWRADEDIRFWNSKSNPGGTGAANSGDNSVVWTPASKNVMIGAKNAYLALKASGTASRADLESAVTDVCQAFSVLSWADKKFPDPHDLPALQTLPNVWKFFDPAKGTNGMVTNLAQWNDRKQELRELAQFYEYGYKPKLGVDYTINIVTNAYAGTGTTATVVAQVVPTNVNFKNGVTTNLTIAVTLPAAGSVPVGQKAVVGFSTSMTANGIANVGLPTNWGADIRTDVGAWGNATTGNRTGTFYTIFPYARNSTAVDVSYEMATATGVSIFLDALQAAAAQNPALDAVIDPTKAITKGFSINAKLAFVAAVFDERVKAVIAGGAGATGPASWRYNAQGQEYSFTGTPFFNTGADAVVSHGTEGPGNSYRHNRVRETELFRHFMPYGHMYVHEEGSYAYGSYSRMPFDNALLVACLAPDRAILIDSNLNDYNDGACTDNLSLQIAKFVYKGLNANADNLVKFNIGSYVSSGDPHGSPSATPEGHYMSDLFYGTQTLTPAEAVRLNTDPYNLNVCNGQTQTPYDYYWGGFNTITGGTGGITGTDGWYSYNINPPTLTKSPADQTVTVGDTVSFIVTATGTGPLTYQWRKDGVALASGGVASGFTTPFLTLISVTTADAGVYDCVVTNPMGSTNSGAAQLTVNKGVADVTLGSLAAIYDGASHAATAATTPAGRNVTFTYDGATAPPVNVGSYAVVATVDDVNYTGSAAGTLVIAKANATVSLSDLTPVYDGAPKPVTVGTTPAGVSFILTYDGSATPPTAAGSYPVSVTITDPNYFGGATATLTIAKAVANVTLSSLAQVYDGAPKPAAVDVTPPGVGFVVTYNGSAAVPTDAGSYAVSVTVTDPNYSGGATGTLTIAKAVATVTLSNLAQVYNGTAKPVTVATAPAGLNTVTTYNGSATVPSVVGSYAVVSDVVEPNYAGTASGTLVISQASAPLTLSDLVQAYDGTPKPVTVATTPANLPVTVTYAGSATAPTYPGSYAVVATINSPSYQGTASGTLVIAASAIVRHAPTLNGIVDGSLQVLSPESITLNGSAAVSGDLLVPGSPTLLLNGHPAYLGTVDASGTSTPSNYQITLNGNAALRHVVRRVNASALPVVAAPPAPTGTRDVSLNNSSQSPGNFATLRNLTLNSNVGLVTVPAGTYGNFTVNGNSGLVLGVAGATQPAVYNLQGLVVNGNGQIKIVGPVIIRLAAGLSLNGPMGEPAHPEWLTLNFAVGGLTLNGNVRCDAYVVAPSGTVTINGNSSLNGGVISDRLTLNGNGLLKTE